MTFAGRFGGVLKPSGVIFDVDGKQKRITDLEHKASDPDFWSDAERSKSVLKQKGLLERSLIDFSELVRGIDDAETLFELGREMDDEASQAEAVALLEVLEPKVRASEVHQMLAEEFDNTDAIVDINSGAGGTDAAD
jgi:peptide chain release factor 2